VAPVFVRTDGHVGGDTIVMAESGDAEVLGAHTLESLGLAADPVQKKLIPTVGMAFMGQVKYCSTGIVSAEFGTSPKVD